jgi:hypothetical protein
MFGACLIVLFDKPLVRWYSIGTMKKKQKHVWKVVESGKNCMTSAIVNNEDSGEYCLIYTVGRETVPVPGSKIFVFRTRGNARAFRNSFGLSKNNVRVLKCEYSGNLEKLNSSISYYYDEESLNMYWKGTLYRCNRGRTVPEGTVLVESVTPVEIVS